MDIESIIPYLSYKNKLYLSAIDKKLHGKIHTVEPDISFYWEMYSTENIKGLDYIYKNYYKSFHSFLDAKHLIKKILEDGKLKLLKWVFTLGKRDTLGYIKNHYMEYSYGDTSILCEQLLLDHGLIKCTRTHFI